MALLGYLSWMLGLAAIGGLLISAVHVKQLKRVQSVDIQVQSSEKGMDMMQVGDVYGVLNNQLGYPLKNLPLEELDLKRVETVVQSHPYIESAEVYLDARHALHIKVTQNIPVLRVIPPSGNSYYLEAGGNPMPLSGAFTARVPVLMGEVPGADRNKWTEKEQEQMDKILDIQAIVSSDEYLNSWIDQLIVQANGTYSMYSALTDQYVDLGEADRLGEQLENVKIFCKNVIPVKGVKKYARIDARYQEQIVGKRRH